MAGPGPASPRWGGGVNIFTPGLSTEWKIFKISVHFKLLYRTARRKTRVIIRVIEYKKGRPVEMLFIITITFTKISNIVRILAPHFSFKLIVRNLFFNILYRRILLNFE